MARSMTGFGSSESSRNGISVNTEIKSLNSRYKDISIYLPDFLRDRELELKEIVQSYIERGKIKLNARVDTHKTGKPDVTIDENLVDGYVQLLQRLKETADVDQSIQLDHLFQFEDIFINRETDEAVIETSWDLLVETTHSAMKQVNQMRDQEGEQLTRDLKERTQKIQQVMETVHEQAEQRAPEAREKLQERIQQLVDEGSYDKERLEMEIAIIADKVDVTEEIVRLQSHTKHFLEALESTGPIGRRLNFLAQEMNREINTIGSKANSSEISQNVVEVKQTLEKIKEQIHNIE